MSPDQSEITELVQQARQGNQTAYQSLIIHFMHQMFVVAYNMVYDYHQTEDIIQESFVKAWQGLNTLNEPGSFRPWILEITRNVARDWLKTQDKKGINLPDNMPDEAGKNDRANRFPEKTEYILDKIDKLPDDYQEIMMMKYINDFSYKDMAQKLGMSTSAVGEKLWRIRDILRDKLKNKNGG